MGGISSILRLRMWAENPSDKGIFMQKAFFKSEVILRQGVDQVSDGIILAGGSLFMLWGSQDRLIP